MTMLFVDGVSYRTEIPMDTPHMIFSGLIARELLEAGRRVVRISCDGVEQHFVMTPMLAFARIDIMTQPQYDRPLEDGTLFLVDGIAYGFDLATDDELMHAVAAADAAAVRERRRVVSIVCDGVEYIDDLYAPIGYFREIRMRTAAIAPARKAVVTLAIGGAFDAVKERVYTLMRAYAQKCGADFHAIEDARIFMPYPHCEKYQVFDLFSRYERILYLDCDVLVSPDAPDIFEAVPIEAVGMLNEEEFCSHLHERRLAMRQLGPIDWTRGYYNSGVVCLSYPQRPLMAKAVRDTIFCAFMDQTVMNYRLFKRGYPHTDLSRRFNHMAVAGEERSDAWFVHYAGQGFLDRGSDGTRLPRLTQVSFDADRFLARLPNTDPTFDPRVSIADIVTLSAQACMRFARGERISLCEQVYMMYGEAMDLTSEQDRAHGTRTLHEKFGFSRHHPQLYAAHFEEMTLDAGARVLIVDLRMIGDSVHIGEMCAAMKARFPGVRITYLCLSGAGHVVGEIGAVDEVLDFSYREYIEEIRAHERAGSLLPMIATVLARVEAGHFDAAININPALLSMFFFYHLRGLTVYGWTFDEQNRAVFRGNLFMYLFAVNRRVHLAEQLIRFLPPTRPLRPDAPLFVPSDDERVPRGSVGIFPGARLATHRWPKEYWAQVVSTVCTVWQMPVVIFGGAKEYGLGEEIMRLADSESAINLCGKIPLSELGAAMARLSCIVSNDSGGKHVAVAGGVPSVEISGSGVPLDQCGPYGAWGAVLQAELDCLNCEDFVCEHCSCMSMVKPAAVLAALKALICARARSVQDAETILEAVSRDPAFADISVWFSGTRRCDESFAYRPIRLRYHPVRGPERLWWFAFDEFCTKKNVALGGGAHRSSLTVRNIAAYMRVFSPQDKAALLREATAIDAGLAAAQEVLADAETLRDAATELDALTVKEAKTMVTLASRLAEMLTAYGAKGDAGAVFVSSLAGDLAIVREAFSRVLRIAECGG